MAANPPRDLVLSEAKGSVRLLTLNNPPVNVLSRPVLESLVDRLAALEQDETVRAVVLASAAPKAFAAGADLREMAPLSTDEARVHGGRGQAATRAIERLPLPVIAAVHGACLGGGCEIALACDLIVASEDAQFGQPEINLGVMPGWGGTRRLPRRIGASRARRWILTGEAVSASQAHTEGLVDRVVPRSDLLATALLLAEQLASKPPVALAAAKFALLHATDPGIDEGLAYELDLWARLFGTRGQQEGMRAFLEKRPPPILSRQGWSGESKGFPWSEAPLAGGPKRNKGKSSGDG